MTLANLLRPLGNAVIGPKRTRDLSRWIELQDWRYRASIERLKKFQNIHRGERCFIIGNGPSLRQTDLTLLKNEVTFGLNRIYLNFDKMGFATTYHVCVNELVIEQCAAEMQQLAMPKFFGWHCRDLLKFDHDTTLLYTRGGLRSWFYTDLTEGCWEGNTVTFVAMQLAYWMGFSEVVLIGVDHAYQYSGKPHAAVVSGGEDPNHFDPNYFGKGFKWHLPDLAGSEMSYTIGKFMFEQAGRRVLDATVGGKLQVFQKVDYASLFDHSKRAAA